MNTLSGARKKQIAIAVLLADFVALSAYAVAHHGYVGIFTQHLTNAAGMQVFVDLVIALTFVMAWMWQDARKHDISPLPYVVLTLGLGSIGPLAYLVHRFGREAAVTPVAPVAMAPGHAAARTA